MLLFVTLSAPALVLALLFSLYAAWSRLTRWRPVAARITGSDYSERERHWDRFVHRDLLCEVEEEHGRWTSETLRWEDEAGVTRFAEHGRWTGRGDPAESARLMWYDPADPRRTSTAGPGTFLLAAGLSAGALALLLRVAAA